jgi:lipid A 3-O-deacylase
MFSGYLFSSDVINKDKNEEKSDSFIDSISLSMGQNTSHNNIYRVAVQSDFNKKLYKNDYGYLDGYFDLSYSRWNYKNENIRGVSFSPVFVYYFDTNYKNIKPFIDFGIGATYISKTSVAEKELSTHFQFEDRIGVGFETKSYRIGLSYFHYSNADLDQPNEGMDMIMLTFTYRF